MVAQLRQKVDEATLPVTIGDMATTTVPGEFTLVYLVFNTIGNLRTQQEQVDCFRNAARHLRRGGRFVIELWVPPLRRLPPGQVAVPVRRHARDTSASTPTTWPRSRAPRTTTRPMTTARSATAPATSATSGRRSATSWPSSPASSWRTAWSGWDRSPFTSDSESHVSVWRKP